MCCPCATSWIATPRIPTPVRAAAPVFYRIDVETEDLETFEVPAEAEETARDVMTRQIIAVDADTMLCDVARKMVDENVHRLLVQDGQRPVGILSTMDLLRIAAK